MGFDLISVPADQIWVEIELICYQFIIIKLLCWAIKSAIWSLEFNQTFLWRHSIRAFQTESGAPIWPWSIHNPERGRGLLSKGTLQCSTQNWAFDLSLKVQPLHTGSWQVQRAFLALTCKHTHTKRRFEQKDYTVVSSKFCYWESWHNSWSPGLGFLKYWRVQVTSISRQAIRASHPHHLTVAEHREGQESTSSSTDPGLGHHSVPMARDTHD